MKEEVQRIISELESEAKRKLTDHEIDLVWRCKYIGLGDRAIRMVTLEKMSPAKEEYVIASFLDGAALDYIETEILPESDIGIIKEKRTAYFSDRLKETDQEYQQILERNENIQAELLAAEERIKQLQGLIDRYEKEKLSNQYEKQKAIQDCEKYKQRMKKLEKALDEEMSMQKSPEIVKKVVTYKRPDNIRDKLKFIATGELDIDEVTVESDQPEQEPEVKKVDQEEINMVKMLCNPDLSLEQVKELQQGVFDGLTAKEISNIAKPEIAVDVMSQMRKFICVKKGIPFTEVQKNQDDSDSVGDKEPADLHENTDECGEDEFDPEKQMEE